MAQLAEQFTRNEQVIGSNPITSSILTCLPYAEAGVFLKEGIRMNKKATDILSYIGIIGWLIAYLAGTKEQSKFHLNQGIVLAIAEIILGVAANILGLIPVVGAILGIVFWVVDVLFLVAAIFGIVSAAQGKETPIPVISSIKILK